MDFSSMTEIVSGAPEAIRATAMVDLSAFYGKPDGTVAITFMDPHPSAIFAVGQDVEILKNSYPTWNDNICSTVALMALSHLKPTPKPGEVITMLYAQFADKKDSKIFPYLSREFYKAFPRLADIDAELKRLKKSGQAPSDTSNTAPSEPA